MPNISAYLIVFSDQPPRWRGKASASVREVVGSIPDQVIQKTLTMVVMSALLVLRAAG